MLAGRPRASTALSIHHCKSNDAGEGGFQSSLRLAVHGTNNNCSMMLLIDHTAPIAPASWRGTTLRRPASDSGCRTSLMRKSTQSLAQPTSQVAIDSLTEKGFSKRMEWSRTPVRAVPRTRPTSALPRGSCMKSQASRRHNHGGLAAADSDADGDIGTFTIGTTERVNATKLSGISYDERTSKIQEGERPDSHCEELCISFKPAMPRDFEKSLNAKHLVLQGNGLLSLPNPISRMQQLVSLSVTWNLLSSLPAWISELRALQEMDASFNQLVHVPAEIGQLCELRSVRLTDNRLARLPATFDALTRLHTLNLEFNSFTTLPQRLLRLPALRTLDVRGNPLLNGAALVGTHPTDVAAALTESNSPTSVGIHRQEQTLGYTQDEKDIHACTKGDMGGPDSSYARRDRRLEEEEEACVRDLLCAYNVNLVPALDRVLAGIRKDKRVAA